MGSGDVEGTTVDIRQEAFEVLGKIKWFNAVKGYGFIAPDGMPGDVFIHHSALRQAGYDAVEQGATVRCEAVRGPKGLDRKSTRLNSSHSQQSRMPSSA